MPASNTMVLESVFNSKTIMDSMALILWALKRIFFYFQSFRVRHLTTLIIQESQTVRSINCNKIVASIKGRKRLEVVTPIGRIDVVVHYYLSKHKL